MILGIGHDNVEINRFTHWHTFSRTQLARIFSPEEIEYCLSQTNQSAARFAVRFAVREAVCKALNSAFSEKKFALLRVSRHCIIKKNTRGVPSCIVNYKALDVPKIAIRTHISLAHTAHLASALVILEKK